MKKRLVHLLLAAGLLLAGALTAFTFPASAQTQMVCVQLPQTGQILLVELPVVAGTPLNPPGKILDPARCKKAATSPTAPTSIPTTPETTPTGPETVPTVPGSTETTTAPEPGDDNTDAAGKKNAKAREEAKAKAKDEAERVKREAAARGEKAKRDKSKKAKKKKKHKKARKPDGSPTASNPGFMDTLPGPSTATGVPNFVINKFRVPVFLLPIYQAAGIQYGVRWEVLAAINEIETDYGRNLNVSSAGALGWMQFIPSTWRRYGVDANKDGKKDPYNPVDAIFASARYLKAAGYEKDARRAVFAYNHADWYVDSVMLRAKLIAGVPADLVGSLTGLTEGRFPVAARARYADDLQEAEATKRVKRGQNAANVVESDANRRSIQIFAKEGSPVVATNDGQIKKIGYSEKLGNYITLQDVYGNRYTYAGLGSVAKYYPVPKDEVTADPKTSAKALKANADKADPKPTKAASAGRQPAKVDAAPPVAKRRIKANAKKATPAAAPKPEAAAPVKQRLFAHPDMPEARESGGMDQLLDKKLEQDSKGFETYKNYFSRPYGVKAKDARLTALKKGSQVIGGTILGRVAGPAQGKASHLDFAIRPAGKGAPKIDPKPILDGWKLLEATAIYRASGRNALYGKDDPDGLSIGQVLLLSKPLLEKRVLADPRVDIYAGGRNDIKSGQIDRRVLATLEYLAGSGLKPTVTSLRGNHGLMTASGNISEHSSGNAVDIGSINGTPIAGHQDPGGITEQTVRRLMSLQGTMRPHQIISLLDFGSNTLSLPDHADHIHVGFRPLYGENGKLGRQALAVLKPGQWSDLLNQLRKIDQPVVPTKPSKYALPAKTGSDAHSGD